MTGYEMMKAPKILGDISILYLLTLSNNVIFNLQQEK